MRSSLCCLTMIILTATVIAVGQDWQQVHSLRSTRFFNASAGRGTITELFIDTCSSTIYALAGLRLISSTDGGRSWASVQLPQGESMYQELGIDGDGCTLYIHWSDQAGLRRTARKMSAEASWEFIGPDTLLFGTLGVHGGVVVIGPNAAASEVYVSRDSGRTWKTFSSIHSSSFSVNPVMQVIDANTLAVLSGSAWLEYSTSLETFSNVRIPDSVTAFAISLDGHVAVASRSHIYDVGKTSRLFLSLDGRSTWSLVGEIKFENADTVLSLVTGGKQVFEVSALLQHGQHVVVILKSGLVFTIDQDGKYWHRGKLARESGNNVYRYAQVLRDGSLRFVDCGRVYDLPQDPTVSVIQRSNDLRLVGQVTMDDSIIIAGGFTAMYRSTDNGRTFSSIKVPEELVDISAIQDYGFKDLQLNRLCITSDSTVIYVAEKGPMIAEYNTKSDVSRIVRVSESLMRQRDAESDGKFCLYNHHLEDAAPDRIGLTAAAFPSWLTYDTTSRSLRLEPGTDYPARFQWEDGRGFAVYQADSVHVTSDTGRTWVSTVPFATTASTLCVRNDGALVLGARGYREIVGEDTIVHAGGIWRSIDHGATWTRASGIDSIQTVTYIFNDGDVLLASSIDAMWNRDLDAYSQNNAYLWRSTDGGITWNAVYQESRYRNAHTGRRKIVRHPNGWYFAISVESGVVVSKDRGITWSQYGSDVVWSRFITDIAVHPEMGVCITTDKGLYQAPVQLTDVQVEEPTGKGAFLTVWAYPTPATDKLRIRINNGQIAKFRFGSLRLFDLNGSVVEDLTQALESSPRSSRIEFDVDVAHIPSGIYLVGLDTGDGFKGAKVVLITR